MLILNILHLCIMFIVYSEFCLILERIVTFSESLLGSMNIIRLYIDCFVVIKPYDYIFLLEPHVKHIIFFFCYQTYILLMEFFNGSKFNMR